MQILFSSRTDLLSSLTQSSATDHTYSGFQSVESSPVFRSILIDIFKKIASIIWEGSSLKKGENELVSMHAVYICRVLFTASESYMLLFSLKNSWENIENSCFISQRRQTYFRWTRRFYRIKEQNAMFHHDLGEWRFCLSIRRMQIDKNLHRDQLFDLSTPSRPQLYRYFAGIKHKN